MVVRVHTYASTTFRLYKASEAVAMLDMLWVSCAFIRNTSQKLLLPWVSDAEWLIVCRCSFASQAVNAGDEPGTRLVRPQVGESETAVLAIKSGSLTNLRH